MTATSVVSLTLEPPSMLICINKNASIHSILSEKAKLSINILSTDQKEFSELCSNKSRENDRFKGDDWSYQDDIPYATNSVSSLFCECKQVIDYETHSIFMCKIISLINNDSNNYNLNGYSGDFFNEFQVNYSDIEYPSSSQLNGLGIVSDIPEFTDPEVGAYDLMPSSPCIDSGDPDSLYDPDGSAQHT